MGKLLPHRDPRPGETFLGGSGILTPYRPSQISPSQIPASPLPTDSTPSMPESSSPELKAWTYQPMDDQEMFEEENEGRPLKINAQAHRNKVGAYIPASHRRNGGTGWPHPESRPPWDYLN